MTPRILLLLGIYLLPMVGGVVALWGWLQLKAFLRSHASISSPRELDDLRRVVKTDMLLALVIIAIVALIVILGALGIFCGLVQWSELAGLLALGSLCLVASIPLTAAEKRVRNIPLEDETLREEFDHILKTWTSSMLPDW